MTQFKNTDQFKLFYQDTDSIYINKDLNQINPEWISSELGKFKLEYIFKDAVFLAPKVYAGLTLENKEIMKIKGYKYKVPFKEFKKLIIKDYNLKLKQTKWFKNIHESNITMLEQLYTLTVTDNKRQLIYDLNKNDMLINTKPYHIHFNKLIHCATPKEQDK